MTEKTSYTQLMNGLDATRGSMPRASNSVNFNAPIQARISTSE